MADTLGNTIRIRGAREHNLRNVDLELPRDQLIVFTRPVRFARRTDSLGS